MRLRLIADKHGYILDPKLWEQVNQWKPVDPALKKEVKSLLTTLMSDPAVDTMAKAAKIKMQIIDKGEDAIGAMIELFLDDPSAQINKSIPVYLSVLR